jgi:hypothetical protein
LIAVTAALLIISVVVSKKANQLRKATNDKEERLSRASPEDLIAEIKGQAAQISERITAAQPFVSKLKQALATSQLAIARIEAGLSPPVFCHTDSESLKKNVRDVRLRQFEVIKTGGATASYSDWTWFGSKSKGDEMLRAYNWLLLRAFNAEFDAIRKQMRYATKDTAVGKLSKLSDVLANLGETAGCYVTHQYLSLKYEELNIWWKELERKELEKKEKKRQKDILRRQAKEKIPDTEDIEEAISYKYSDVKRAREIAKSLVGFDAEQAQAAIEKMEAEIKALEEKFARATSQAQLTRAGYVYVISNIGSFGEGVVKIGMTRRLEPMDRVRELGDASVPYRFDVHALIFSEDAPTLERTLHNHFSERRVNADNLRKEFFKASPEEVSEVLSKLGIEGDWYFDAEAREHHESELLRTVRLKAESKQRKALIGFPETI